MNQILMWVPLFISYGGEPILSIQIIWGQLQKEYESTVQWFMCSVEMWKTEVHIILPTNIYLYKSDKLQSIYLNIKEFSLWAVFLRMPHGPDVPRRSYSKTISLPSLWYSVALCVCVLIILCLVEFYLFIYFCETRLCPQWQSQVTTTADRLSVARCPRHPFFKL